MGRQVIFDLDFNEQHIMLAYIQDTGITSCIVLSSVFRNIPRKHNYIMTMETGVRFALMQPRRGPGGIEKRWFPSLNESLLSGFPDYLKEALCVRSPCRPKQIPERDEKKHIHFGNHFL